MKSENGIEIKEIEFQLKTLLFVMKRKSHQIADIKREILHRKKQDIGIREKSPIALLRRIKDVQRMLTKDDLSWL